MQTIAGKTGTSSLTCTGSLAGGYYRIRINGTKSATANQNLILYPSGSTSARPMPRLAPF